MPETWWSRLRAWRPTPKQLRLWAIIGASALAASLVAFVFVARATDSSTYCKSCHEMVPFYDAWTQGGHATTAQCIDCHVNAGVLPRLAHKIPALAEVWAHFVGNAGFPMASAANVPDRRCVRCHKTIAAKNAPAGFSHDMHAKQGPCQMCHATTGHEVTAQALQAAGVFNARNAAMRAAASTTVTAVVGGGKADIPGHLPVSCSACHDMAAMGCAACHTAPHEARGDCALCHKPGKAFTFSHPQTRMEGWQRIPCVKCHPVSYTQVSCTCHKNGIPSGD